MKKIALLFIFIGFSCALQGMNDGDVRPRERGDSARPEERQDSTLQTKTDVPLNWRGPMYQGYTRLELMNALRDEDFFKACMEGNLENVKYWVEQQKADVNKVGPSPLMIASMKGDFPLIEYLVSHGADVNFADEFGHTALYLACSNPNCESVENVAKIMYYLIVNGADLSVKDRFNHTPYHYLGKPLFTIPHTGLRSNIDEDEDENVIGLIIARGSSPDERSMLEAKLMQAEKDSRMEYLRD